MNDIETPTITSEEIAKELGMNVNYVRGLLRLAGLIPILKAVPGRKARYLFPIARDVVANRCTRKVWESVTGVMSPKMIAQREFKTDIDLVYGPVIGQESDGSPRRKYLGYSPQDPPAHTACYVKAAAGWDAKPGEWGGPDDPGSPPVPPIKGSTDQFDTAGIACIIPIAKRLWKEYVDKINLYR